MKPYIFSLAALSVLFLMVFSSCQKKNELNLNLNPVSNLTAPANGEGFDLETLTTNEFKFNWQTTQAEDGGLVLYEVLFDKEGGDFSEPFYTSLSDGRGVQNTLTLTKAQLDAIAGLAGAAPLASANVIWTVRASKGWNGVNATQNGAITIKRMLPLPSELSVTGSGTEAGANKIKMTKLSDGLFEVFVKVKAGEMAFVSPENVQYGLQQSAGKWNIVGGSATTGLSGSQEKVLWIKIDFGAKSGWVAEVKNISLFYPNQNKTLFDLPYIGNGTWRRNAVADFLSPAGWTSREERYKYVMTINDGGTDRQHWLNSFLSDPGGQDGAYPSSLDYRSIDLTRNRDSWDYGWKIDRNYITPSAVADYWVQMNATEKYNQNYKKP